MNEFIEYLKNSGSEEMIIDAKSEKEEDEKDEDRIMMSGKRILLVDDNELNLEIAQAILEMAGFDVDTAGDGTEAVEKVSKCGDDLYDLVLMDIRMPIMDGYEATRRIRRLPDARQSQVPVVALTAFSDEESNKTALDAGMNAHLEKPLSMDKLEALLQFV